MSKFKRVIAPLAGLAAPVLLPGIGALGSAAIGAGAGALSGGGIKGALIGGLSGGLGSALAGSGALGQVAGSPLSAVTGIAKAQGPTMGSGIAGSVSRALGTGAATGGIGRLGSMVKPAINMYSMMQSEEADKEMRRQLMQGQKRAEALYQPYGDIGLKAQEQLSGSLTQGFDPQSLSSDPGYQYRVQQGQQALERSLAAQGMGQSGAALRAAQELGQGLASQQYDTAYNQWLERNRQLAGLGASGQDAAGSLAGVYGTMGDIGANRALSRSNTLNRALSDLLYKRES